MARGSRRRGWAALLGWVLIGAGAALATAPALQGAYGAGWQAHLRAQLAVERGGGGLAPPAGPWPGPAAGPGEPGGAGSAGRPEALPGGPGGSGEGPAGGGGVAPRTAGEEGARGTAASPAPGVGIRWADRLWGSPAVETLLELLGRWIAALERVLSALLRLLVRLGVPEGWLAWWWDDPAVAGPGGPGAGAGADAARAGGGGVGGAGGAGPEAGGVAPGQAVARLVIPRAGVDAVVLYGTSRPVLARGPGLYPEGDLPGPGARVAIAAHRTTYGAWFRHLDRLRPGDPIALWYRGRWYRYRVDRLFATRRDDWPAVLNGPRPGLILTTCHPPGSSRQRLVVYAIPAGG